MPCLALLNPMTVFLRSDVVGQSLIAFLGVCSIIAWAVMIGKRSELGNLRRLNHAFEQRLKEERNLLELPESLRNRRGIPYADLFAEAYDAYWRAATVGKEKGIDTSRFRLEHAENALQRALARQSLRYESSMIFLASIVSGAPFLGLLGTVYGVMDAFGAVSLQQSASIQTLAPGVSAALLATTSGLIVAIPCVFGYNYLLARTRVMVTELENFASSLADRIETESQ
ncbi:MAG TPA: MotA/TolQ/ExbB proton channel family protein [Opitutaceae bacterium]|jgi:biopolymer transport protein TolQ|nr:MotA/TolQ/ExbB proton channel family protein [Opitutaceae bacterium]